MNKAISAGIGVAIGLVALAAIFLGTDDSESEAPMGVDLSDQVTIETEDSKSFDVNLSEGVKVGDGTP